MCLAPLPSDANQQHLEKNARGGRGGGVQPMTNANHLRLHTGSNFLKLPEIPSRTASLMRQILAIALAFIGLLSSADGILVQTCSASERVPAVNTKCDCCATRAACACETSSDQAPKSVPVPARNRLDTPSCPCVPAPSCRPVMPMGKLAEQSAVAAQVTVVRPSRLVPMFILHCAALC
jgi:hypothetical protein